MDNVIDLNEKAKPRKASAGGSGGGYDTPLEVRVGNLEIKIDKMDARLDNIEKILAEILAMKTDFHAMRVDLAKIEGKLETKASAVDLARVEGKITQIPNVWQYMLGLISFAGFIYASVKFIK